MEETTLSDLIKSVAPALMINGVRELVEFYYYTGGDGGQSISLLLVMESEAAKYYTRLDFDRVSDVKISGLSPGVALVGFDVVNIARNGWEGINWVVEDYETGILRFYALHARVASVVPLASVDVLGGFLARPLSLRD
jgi:hypothetical protein